MLNTILTLFVCLFVCVLSAPTNHLDVFIARKELKRFFHEFDIGDFYIIRKGVVNMFFQNQGVINYVPAIAPTTHSLELRFQSKHKLYYRLRLSSSDKETMKTPKATITTIGQVPRKIRAFKIRFPCNRRKSGEVILTVKMEFMAPSRKKTPLRQFVLRLKRKCEKARKVVRVKPPETPENAICNKKCDREMVRRRFCISDFAVRARVERHSIAKDGRMRYRVKITKYYKTGRVSITNSRKQYIVIRGRDITCRCGLLQPRRTYLLLGKEDVRTKTLFLDDYTYAIDWSRGGKKLAKLHKKKDTCPKRLYFVWHTEKRQPKRKS